MSKLLLRAFLPAILAAIPGSLFAVDGVVLIDQAHALAGGITSGDAPGFPITISESGSYRLSGNLTVPDANTTAIEVQVGDVTIDLNGFSIIGPTVCNVLTSSSCSPAGSGEGIVSHVGKGIKVLNGTVRGMGSNGIDLSVEMNSAEKVNAHDNGGIGIFVAGTVIDCAAILNGAVGIAASLVQNSQALSNGSDGISVSFGVATGNLSMENSGHGVVAACPSVLVNNVIGANGKADLSLSGSNCASANNGIGF